MSRLPALDASTATGPARDVLAELERRHGRASPMIRAMANSPAVLQAYRDFNRALKRTELSPQLRVIIALAVAEQNGCEYCVASYTAAARQLGLTEQEIADARRGRSADAQDQAALDLVRGIVTDARRVTDCDVETIREMGFSDAELAEIVATVALNQFTNAFNNAFDVLPEAEPGGRRAEAQAQAA
jgi:uncharacterized peroxidase-related enzyme